MDICKFQVILLFVFFTIATSLDDVEFVKILKYEFTRGDDDPNSYFYQYETSDGQTKEEKGEHADSSDFIVRGSYSYMGADGIQYTVNYYADKDGYHPSGDHINVPPYTPWPVNRILADDEPEKPMNDDPPKPDDKYLPTSEKPVIFDDFATSIQNRKHNVPSTTPQPPLPSVTNTYIPASPSVIVEGHSNRDEVGVRVGGYPNDRNPYASNSPNSVTISNRPPTAYIPSTPSPRVGSVTVTPSSLRHVAAASTSIPVTEKEEGKNRRGRARNLAAYRKAQSDLFEVIQNNHSSQGVFKND